MLQNGTCLGCLFVCVIAALFTSCHGGLARVGPPMDRIKDSSSGEERTELDDSALADILGVRFQKPKSVDQTESMSTPLLDLKDDSPSEITTKETKTRHSKTVEILYRDMPLVRIICDINNFGFNAPKNPQRIINIRDEHDRQNVLVTLPDADVIGLVTPGLLQRTSTIQDVLTSQSDRFLKLGSPLSITFSTTRYVGGNGRISQWGYVIIKLSNFIRNTEICGDTDNADTYRLGFWTPNHAVISFHCRDDVVLIDFGMVESDMNRRFTKIQVSVRHREFEDERTLG